MSSIRDTSVYQSLFGAAVIFGALVSTGCAPMEHGLQWQKLPSSRKFHTNSIRCTNQECTCRSLDSDSNQEEESIAPGRKRFEFRLPRSTSAIWVLVDDKRYFKPTSSIAPSCFYLDLTPGVHKVKLLAEHGDPEIGLQAGLTVYEHGPKLGPYWYRVLHFTCGNGANRCTAHRLAAWSDMQRALPKGALNRCSSTRVRRVRFSGSRLPDYAHPTYQRLVLALELKVYNFEPYRQPDDSSCR